MKTIKRVYKAIDKGMAFSFIFFTLITIFLDRLYILDIKHYEYAMYEQVWWWATATCGLFTLVSLYILWLNIIEARKNYLWLNPNKRAIL